MTDAPFALRGSVPSWLSPQTVELPGATLTITDHPESSSQQGRVEVELVFAHAPEDFTEALRAADEFVDPLLLAMTMETARPAEVEWSGGLGPVRGRPTLVVFVEPLLLPRVRHPLESLSTYLALAAVIAEREEVRQATTRLRAAYGFLATDVAAACSLAFLAAEGLVVTYRQRAGLSDRVRVEEWTSACGVLGVARDEAILLWNSLQTRRHHWARGSIDALIAAGRQPLSPRDCCDRVAATIEAYIDWLTSPAGIAWDEAFKADVDEGSGNA